MKTTDFENKSFVEKYQKYLLVNKYFGKPAFLEFMGDVNGLNILDLGCGTGHFSKDLTKKGATYTGIDKSSKMIDIAKEAEKRDRPGIDYRCLNGANLEGISSAVFDKTFLFQVLLNVPESGEVKNIFKEVGRVLKADGEILFSVFHPKLIQNYKDNIREIVIPSNCSYFDNGMKYTARHLTTDFNWLEFRNSHWTLDFISNVLKENEFTITEIKEPKPKKDEFWDYFKNIYRVPHYLFIKSHRID